MSFCYEVGIHSRNTLLQQQTAFKGMSHTKLHDNIILQVQQLEQIAACASSLIAEQVIWLCQGEARRRIPPALLCGAAVDLVFCHSQTTPSCS